MKRKKGLLTLSAATCLLLVLSACCINHEWREATCVNPKTCQKCGETEGESLGHEWSDATCVNPKVCQQCEETEGSALGHEWKNATCDKPKTCQRCGESEGEALGHTWIEATCKSPKRCIVCDATMGDPLKHDWQEATCTQAEKCRICGSTNGAALGHQWEAATTEKPKTCTVCAETEGGPLQLIYQNGLFLLSPKELGERIKEFEYGADMYYNLDGMYCGIKATINWGDYKKGDAIAIILFGSKYDVMGVSEKDSKTVQSLTAKFFVTDATTITSTMVDLMMACDDTLDDNTAREVGKKVVAAMQNGDISYSHNGLTYTFTRYKGDYVFMIAVNQ